MATAEQGTVRQTVRERREALGWSQRALSRAAKISRPTLVQIEQDERHANDITSIKTTQTSRRKVVETLDREERERRERADRLGVEAWNATARAVANINELLDRGAMTPGGGLLAICIVVDNYGDAIAEIDPVAVEQAAKYKTAMLKSQMKTRAERN